MRSPLVPRGSVVRPLSGYDAWLARKARWVETLGAAVYVVTLLYGTAANQLRCRGGARRAARSGETVWRDREPVGRWQVAGTSAGMWTGTAMRPVQRRQLDCGA